MKFGELIDMIESYTSLKHMAEALRGCNEENIIFRDVLRKMEDIRETEIEVTNGGKRDSVLSD